jgi:uncharacterized protein (DUF2141 family)
MVYFCGMKYLLIWWLSLAALLPGDDTPARLDIYLEWDKQPAAQWIIYIYDSPEDFPVHPHKAFKKLTVRPRPGQPVRILLPPGQYAIAAYVDRNGNGRIDRNWLGLPAEPYALSGNPAFHFGPPRFEECQISVRRPQTVVRLKAKEGFF